MVTPSIFDLSEVNYFHQTDLKASLEIIRPKTQLISVNVSVSIQRTDSKYRANFLFWNPTALQIQPFAADCQSIDQSVQHLRILI